MPIWKDRGGHNDVPDVGQDVVGSYEALQHGHVERARNLEPYGQDPDWLRPLNGSAGQPISCSVARPHLSASGASGRHGIQIVVCAEKEGSDGTSSRIQKEGNAIVYDVH